MKSTRTRAVTVIGAVLALGLTGLGAYAVADPGSEESPEVTEAVTKAFVDAKADEARSGYGLSAKATLEPLVEPKRTSADGDWVFGGAVFLLPDDSEGAPVTSLFFAHRTDAGWKVSLKGTGAFAKAAYAAPDDIIIDSGERDSLAASARPASIKAAKADDPGTATGLALPWKQLPDRGWRHWGVHGDAGSPRPWNSIDFYGGDGKVGASAAGYLYRFCGTETPLLQVQHDNGWTTEYYHTLDQTTVADGSRVEMYDYLGHIGEQLPCGGAADGDHVHWSLWQGDEAVSVEGLDIGGWTWHEGTQPYYGWAKRETIGVPRQDCCLTNYGPTETSP